MGEESGNTAHTHMAFSTIQNRAIVIVCWGKGGCSGKAKLNKIDTPDSL